VNYLESYRARIACATLDWNKNQGKVYIKYLKMKPFVNSNRKRATQKKLYLDKWKCEVQKMLLKIRKWEGEY
jgi:hypothetical protein